MAPEARLSLALLAISSKYRKNDANNEAIRIPAIDDTVAAFKKSFPSIFVSEAEDKRRCAEIDAKNAAEKVRRLDRVDYLVNHGSQSH